MQSLRAKQRAENTLHEECFVIGSETEAKV